jgi:protein involved in polysaccharide export with SLBB domain
MRRPVSRSLAGLGPCLCIELWACTPEIPPAPPESARAAASSAVRPGDALEIRVFDEDRFGGEFQVGDDGAIDFPMVGSLDVTGKTKDEVARMLEQRLADGFLNNPQVSVQVKQRGNREVSVLGQVNKAGSFDYRDGLTVVQAVSLAGGPGAFAAPARVKVTRRTGVGDETVTFEVSLPAIFNGKAEDLVLRPGDIVFVPESRI